jgi:hypothetical protein
LFLLSPAWRLGQKKAYIQSFDLKNDLWKSAQWFTKYGQIIDVLQIVWPSSMTISAISLEIIGRFG